MDKMRMESVDMTERNIEAMAMLFPNCITEVIDEERSTPQHKIYKKAVNFEKLRQMLTGEVAEGTESYEFTWVGKKSAIIEANRSIRKTLRPCVKKSVNWDNTENIYIEGDNLEALKILQESYLGKIKVIYIDPPYNTGHDFVYPDSFIMDNEDYNEGTGYFDNDGNVNFSRENSQIAGKYHSDWCSMIYSRLMLCRNLLSDDGAIFISIDDHEQQNIRKICDEVFGEDHFVSNICWQKVYSPKNNNIGMSSEVEYILCYSKSADWAAGKLERTDKMNSMYKNPDNDPEGEWTSSDATAPGAVTHQGMVYAIQSPFSGKMFYPTRGCCWRKFQDDLLEIMNGWAEYKLQDLNDEKERASVCGIEEAAVRKGVKAIVLAEPLESAQKKANETLENGVWPLFYFTKNGEGGLRKKTYLKDMEGRTATNFWPYAEVGHNDEAKKEVASLFDGHAPFDTPKPVRLMERILKIASDKDSIILDFFSGSASMGHAVMKANSLDGGKRKYILIQVQEPSNFPGFDTLCDVGIERLRRAADVIKKESNANIDYGVRVFCVDESNMNDVYYSAGEYSQDLLSMLESNVKSDRTDLDLLFGCLLEWGLPLSMPYTSEEIEGCKVHTYNEGDLIACFDENIPDSVIKEIARRQPLRAVFRDSSFKGSPSKINVGEIFKMLAPDTRVKVI